MWSVIIMTGGREAGGNVATTASTAIRTDIDARFEHRGIVGRLRSREREIRLADLVQRRHGRRPTVAPRSNQRLAHAAEPALRNIGEQRIAVAEMAVRRRRTDTCRTRRVGKREPSRALLRDQRERRLDQRFLEVAVVVAASQIRPPRLSRLGEGPYSNPATTASGPRPSTRANWI